MKNTINKTSDNDLNELDRLVYQEIDALQRNHGKQITGRRKAKKRKAAPTDNVIYRDGWKLNENEFAEQEENPANEHEANKLDETQLDEQEYDSALIDDPQPALASADELFTEKEQDFIQRSADWLANRENKDLIINKIWDQLTQSVPDSFYSAKQQAETNSEPENMLDKNPQEFDNTDIPPADPST